MFLATKSLKSIWSFTPYDYKERGVIRVSAKFSGPIDLNNIALCKEFIYSTSVLVKSPKVEEMSDGTPHELAVEEGKERPAQLSAWLEGIPAGLPYAHLARRSGIMTHQLRQALAELLAPALNATLQTMLQETLEQKKAICEFVNSELEPLGLAVRCPKTGLPAKLKASTGNWVGVGRFHFEVYIDGKRKIPALSDTLPELHLIDLAASKQSELTWKQRVASDPANVDRGDR